MARSVGKLTAMAVAKAKSPGMYPDGGGLYLQIARSGARSWIFRFMLNRRSREMGLGGAGAVSLAEARNKATECRRLTAAGIDPITIRIDQRTQSRLEAARAKTFKECADAYVAAHEAAWRNEKHRSQWRN